MAASPTTAPGQKPGLPSLSRSPLIRDVWAENVEEEFASIRELIKQYPFVAMDTEFPGVVAKPVGTFKTTHEFYYQTLRCNVNLLKIIQLGVTLMNERGEVLEKCCTWQFNFRFSLDEDLYATDSIDLLKSGGINFDHFAKHGIDMIHFGELLTGSGLVLNDEVTWLAFHAGYDFGYLIKVLSGRELPDKEEDFQVLFHTYFPSIYDVKYVLRQTPDLSHTLGLDALSDTLGVRRIGQAHQAGSDSLLTGHAFFKIIRDRFQSRLPTGSVGVLYGLGEDVGANQQPTSSSQSTPPVVTQNSPSAHPSSANTPTSANFPSTPIIAMVMHGGSRDAKVHQKQ